LDVNLDVCARDVKLSLDLNYKFEKLSEAFENFMKFS